MYVTFDLVCLQVEVLQCGADYGDSLQLVEAQVQLHQPRHVEGVGGDALVCQLVVAHPDILQLCETTQEVCWHWVDGVGLQIELVQMVREGLRDLGSFIWKVSRKSESCL